MKKNINTRPKNKLERDACQDIIKKAIKNNIKTPGELLILKKQACEKYSISFVSNPKLLVVYKKLVSDKEIKSNKQLFELLRKRRIRTSSGIASVAVLTKPYPCPGKCIFCPSQKNIPKSYINNEPAVMRAILCNYDPVKQIKVRLKGFEIAGNPNEKIELIVMGGTFSYLPRIYQLKFIIGCFWICNNYDKMTNQKLKIKKNSENELVKILKKEQKINENAKYKIVGLTLETRPDYIDQNEIKRFREYGCTRVEIGVQSIDDRILKLNKRGHKVKEIVKATKLLKDAGFKVNYHMMPNLYGSTIKKDIDNFRKLFSMQEFQPDMLKIYPCVVTKYSNLLKQYKDKKYIPYTDKELCDLLINIKKIIPPYVRIQRLIRDIPAQNIVAGSKISNLRQLIFNQKNVKCNCIRCREIREDKKKAIFLDKICYKASDGEEIFLQYIDKDNKIYAMLRLRIPSCVFSKKKHFIKDLENCAIIREVHTFGQMALTGEKNKSKSQHKGMGKKLIKVAEQIAKNQYKLNKIAVISGIGVKGYYKKLGYKEKGLYLIKNI